MSLIWRLYSADAWNIRLINLLSCFFLKDVFLIFEVFIQFDGDSQSTMKKVISLTLMSKWMQPSGLRRLSGNQKDDGTSSTDVENVF